MCLPSVLEIGLVRETLEVNLLISLEIGVNLEVLTKNILEIP